MGLGCLFRHVCIVVTVKLYGCIVREVACMCLRILKLELLSSSLTLCLLIGIPSCWH
uniref:Uncharacterized protein n=1 Tax=Rhizophora mucronata TaxID=61149 RepID=A0A2P2QG78_RHIMU